MLWAWKCYKVVQVREALEASSPRPQAPHTYTGCKSWAHKAEHMALLCLPTPPTVQSLSACPDPIQRESWRKEAFHVSQVQLRERYPISRYKESKYSFLFLARDSSVRKKLPSIHLYLVTIKSFAFCYWGYSEAGITVTATELPVSLGQSSIIPWRW